LFRVEIGDELTESGEYSIHGDWHGKNVLVNGKFVHLDWANAASNGFPEFDIGKLLTKSNLDEDLEERLVRYASEKLFETEEEREESVNRFAKNQIAQELLSAKRYLARAEKSEQGKEKLQNMANVWYNSAVRRIRKAVRNGILTDSFLEEVCLGAPSGCAFMSNEEFERLKSQYNPNAIMSQEAMQPTTPLVDLIPENSGDSLRKIKKAISSGKKFHYFKRIAAPLVALGLAALLAGGVKYSNHLQREQVLKETGQEAMDNYMLRAYQATFEEAYGDVKTGIIDGDIKKGFSENSDIVENVAKEYGLESSMLNRMIKVNRCYAGIQKNLNRLPTLKEVNILDPFLVRASLVNETPVVDPEENLRAGAKRLAELMKEHKGNLKEALIDFYDPVEGDAWGYGNGLSEREMGIIHNQARQLAYNVMHGLDFAYDGGMMSIYLSTPPKDF
jgi:hypothetical protein